MVFRHFYFYRNNQRKLNLNLRLTQKLTLTGILDHKITFFNVRPPHPKQTIVKKTRRMIMNTLAAGRVKEAALKTERSKDNVQALVLNPRR